MKYKLLIILSFVILFYIHYGKRFYTYYSPAKEHIIYQTARHKDDSIRIAYIGDSWADGHQDHNCIIANIISNYLSKPVIISSFGISGLTSKEIYNALFELNSLKQYMKKGFNYCIISAGINDCNKKMSVTYYKKSMDCIIRFMLENNIFPIILEIPDYNILDAYEKQTINKKFLCHLSMFVNGTQMDCKQQFRDALDELIIDKGDQNKVSIIRYKTWNNDYETDLKEMYIGDQIHLNDKGYAVLDSVIANVILNIEHNKASQME